MTMKRLFLSCLPAGWAMLAIITFSLLIKIVDAGAAVEVVELSEATFEHQTQASTGMTTGSWLVFFHTPSCEGCQTLGTIVEETLAATRTTASNDDEDNDFGSNELEERGIVFGSVDCQAHPKVCQRFDVAQLPTMLFLHQKKLYKFPSSDNQNDGTTSLVDVSPEILKRFVLKDYAQVEPLPIPPPQSAIDEAWAELMNLYQIGMREENQLWLAAIGFMAVMLITTIVILLYTLAFGGSAASTKSTTVDKSKSKVKNGATKKTKAS